ncbi:MULTISPECIES: hypothetical protein [unclassified Nostoc]|uniref:hypothetical protein n=1 Tax=unclassified Nostoc TaxID=2593658 RepID=UPI000CF31736|nr:hypothetical protein [Nostoc sp. 'Peltigera membranacea cyanobiont' N6]AVH67123.1 hypothetical protein NPM_5696 [Nostoc sp. 'Peltigera membranacea cyanobiont' N6]
MNTIQEYLYRKQERLIQSDLFQNLKTCEYDLEDFARLAHNISFWVMSFQDLLRINLLQISDKKYYTLIQQHLLEDMGHEKWFLDDLQEMNVEQPNLQVLYSKPYTAVRDATFFLMSEVFRTTSDYERIILILTLESAGHIFFECIADFLEKNNWKPNLKYFSKYHLSAEKNHDIFENEIQLYLNTIQLNYQQEIHLFKMIDRIYEAFSLMFNGLSIALSSSRKVEFAL